jgi:hypothetical protein
MKIAKLLAVGLALSVIAAPTFAQGQGGQGRQGRQGFGGRGGGGSFLLQIPEVQKELKIDEGQLEALKLLNEANQAKARELRQNSANLSDDQRREQFRAMTAANQKEVAKILNAQQVARLKQLEIQRAGLGALRQPEVQAALNLTADQKAKLEAQQTADREAMRAVFQGFRGQDGQRPTPEQLAEARTKMQAMRTASEAKTLAILTDAQKKQFEAMKGAAFTFPQRQGGRRRGGNNGNNN